MQKQMTRRDFVGNSARLGAAALTALSLGAGVSLPAWAGEEDGFPQKTFGGKGAAPRALVAYASACGSTAGIALAIGQTLAAKGWAVDVKLCKRVEDLSPYRAAVVGGAVRRGRLLGPARDLLTEKQAELAKIPLACFAACIAMAQDTRAARQKSLGYLQAALGEAPGLKPVAMGTFAGALDYDKLSFFMAGIMRSKMKKKGIKAGDYRDMAKIAAWAGEVAGLFANQAGPKI